MTPRIGLRSRVLTTDSAAIRVENGKIILYERRSGVPLSRMDALTGAVTGGDFNEDSFIGDCLDSGSVAMKAKKIA